MRISQLELTKFKRFEKLIVEGLTRHHRFVYLLGPNGSGKSSVFEAFNVCRSIIDAQDGFDRWYYIKQSSDADKVDPQLLHNERKQWSAALKGIAIEFFDKAAPQWVEGHKSWEAEAFHLRGSHRATPSHQSGQIEPWQDLSRRRPSIDIILGSDPRLTQNYQRLVHHAQFAYLNPGELNDIAVANEALKLFRQLQQSTSRVFPGLTLEGLGNPTDQGTFVFRKEGGKLWRYKNLSAGEKSAFDVLLDLVVTAEVKRDTIYCIDEPELHMHSELQARLMNEIAFLAPADWQVWFATHSIGMVRWAAEYLQRHPGEVAFLDFHGQPFDQEVTLSPQTPSRHFWKRQFGVAIGDLADLVIPREIFLCEGRAHTSDGFDAIVLQRIFGETHPDVAFVSVGGGKEVEKNGALLAALTKQLTPACVIRRVYDRDDRTESEIERIRDQNDCVLTRRELENYLFDDEILTKLFVRHGAQDQLPQFAEQKRAAIDGLNSRGKMPDDIKSAAPQIYQAIRKILAIPQAGSTYEAFAVEHLVPLIGPTTEIYRLLENDLWPFDHKVVTDEASKIPNAE